MRYALVFLAACGGGGGASVEQMAHSKALACVLDKQTGDQLFPFDSLANQGSPRALRAVGLAYHERDNLAYLAAVANALADRGAKSDAAALLDLPELARLDDDFEVGLGTMVGEIRLRAGRPAKPAYDREMIALREQALGGDVTGATAAFDALHVTHVEMFDTVPYVTALAAIGRDDDADAALANAPGELVFAAAEARLEVALVTGKHLSAAVEAVIAHQDRTSPKLAEVIAFARATGHANDVAPLRQALVEDPSLDPAVAIALAGEVTADERPFLDRALAQLPPDDYRRTQVTALDAIRADTLDDALAAVENLAVDDPDLWLRLWLRHAAAGLDSGFETRMIDACRAS